MVSKRVEFILAQIKEKEYHLLYLCEQFYDLKIRNLFTGEVSEQINNLMTEMDLLTTNLLNYENPKPSHS